MRPEGGARAEAAEIAASATLLRVGAETEAAEDAAAELPAVEKEGEQA